MNDARPSVAAPSRRSLLAAALLGLVSLPMLTWAVPQPGIAPRAWELDLDYRTPQRIVVDVPGQGPRAYWYMVYTVTNESDEVRFFIPRVELHTDDGRNIRSDRGIPGEVYQAIRDRTRSLRLTLPQDMVGRLLVGRDEAKSSMAVWAEPKAEMGTFDIFFAGLSGDRRTATNPVNGEPLKNAQGEEILIEKTKQLTYKVRGDVFNPEEDTAVRQEEKWVMR